jgi:hypothetical protein
MVTGGFDVGDLGVQTGPTKDIGKSLPKGVPAVGADLGIKEIEEGLKKTLDRQRSHSLWTSEHPLRLKRDG